MTLNGDGINDLVLDIGMQLSPLPQSLLLSLNGPDGSRIWSHDEYLAATLAYSVEDCIGDNVTDLVAHTFAPYSNGSISTRICTLDGRNGTRASVRTFPDSLALEYPAGNLTDDGREDRLRMVYSALGHFWPFQDPSRPQIVEGPAANSSITALDPHSRRELWTLRASSLLLALPVIDLTADGLNDVLIYRLNQTDGGLELALLEGFSGPEARSRSYSTLALPGPDLTGDGAPDLLVYRPGEEADQATEPIQALSGRDGRLLWQSRGPVLYSPW
ncbi:MAG: hypothetical protein GKC10_08485 [Methanosarcinales archaeon]|nr:hypothetical protein [Methanosarcinales archaeon]